VFTNGNNRATVPLNNRVIKKGGCKKKKTTKTKSKSTTKKPVKTVA